MDLIHLSPISRVYLYIPATVTLEDGSTTAPTGIDVALMPHDEPVTSATTWTAASYDSTKGKWRVLVAWPEADPTGATFVVDRGTGSDLHIRDIDTPEVTAVQVARLISD